MIHRSNISIPSIVLIMLLSLAMPSSAGSFDVYSNTMPPIKYIKNGTMQGVAGEVLTEIMNSAGICILDKNIHTCSWSKAYTITRDTPRTICIAMARTPQREHLFKWVGPVYTTKLGLISKKKRNIHLETLEDTKELTISTFIDSTMDNILLAKGVPNDRLVRKQRVSEAMDLLITDKVDLLAYTLTPTLYSLQLKGIDPTDYEMALEMRTVDLYIAFNKTTEDALINKLQTAFETMKKPNSDGESPYDRIISHYFLPKM